MKKIKVTAYFEPDEDQRDPEDPSGLNEETFDELLGDLMNIGLSGIDVMAV